MESTSARRLAVLRSHLVESDCIVADGITSTSSSSSSARGAPASPAARSAPLLVLSAAEAVADIKNGDTITVGGFVGTGFPEALVEALRARHDATGSPRDLRAVVVAAVGDGKGRGLGRLAVPSLLSKLTYAWIGLCPEFGEHLRSGAIKGVNLPLGAVSHMIRDCAAGRPGPLTRVGIGTFVDPRERGEKQKKAPNASDGGGDDDYPVRVVEFGGVDFLQYRAPEAIDVALLRGTVADADGNVGFSREALLGDCLNQAIAAHNSWHRKRKRALEKGSARESGGPRSPPRRAPLRVVVQVEEVLPAGAPRLPARAVAIPGHLVDALVVVKPSPSSYSYSSSSSSLEMKQHRHHEQVIGVAEFEGALCGGERGGAGGAVPRSIASSPPPQKPLPRGARRVVANRALLELLSSPSSSGGPLLINVGVGMPEGVAALLGDRAATAALLPGSSSASSSSSSPSGIPALTLSTEAGALGGTPAGGKAFGASHDAAAHVPLPTMLDLYQGGGVAVAVLGMAEVSRSGDVNVSSFPGRSPGCGGFIDISQSARKVVFVGTFTSGGLHVAVADGGGGDCRGALSIASEGRHPKFKDAVGEVTFAGSSAAGREVVYVTERAVFRLREEEPEEGENGKTSAAAAARKRRTVVEVCEVAPGIDVERDVISKMAFRPAVPKGGVRLMDARCLEGV